MSSILDKKKIVFILIMLFLIILNSITLQANEEKINILVGAKYAYTGSFNASNLPNYNYNNNLNTVYTDNNDSTGSVVSSNVNVYFIIKFDQVINIADLRAYSTADFTLNFYNQQLQLIKSMVIDANDTSYHNEIIEQVNYVAFKTPGRLYDFYLSDVGYIPNPTPEPTVTPVPTITPTPTPVPTITPTSTPVPTPTPITTAPEAPVISSYTLMSDAFRLSWSRVTTATTYKIYLNDVLIRSNVDATNYLIQNLEKDVPYVVKIVATNAIGDSDYSVPISFVLTDSLIPSISFTYDLADISDGVSEMFSSLWLILVFCISIPLSFIIGNRVKRLF